MPPVELLIAFFAAAAIFAYMPGPAMLYATAQTLARGRRAGAMAALGIHLGAYVHIGAAALGLAAMFHAAPIAFLIIKAGGAAYLVWLGVQMIRSAGRADAPAAAENIVTKSARQAFVESVIVEVANPKAALFFFAFLPQFVDPSAGLPIWGQLLALGVIANLMFSSADLICVTLAGALASRLRSSGRAQAIAKRIGGTALIGLGANLALQKA